MIDCVRLRDACPLPNRLDGDRLALPWYRALDRAVAQGNGRSLRGGDRRTFYVHPPNARKGDRSQWLAVLDRVEHGVVPSVQEGRVEWTGGLADWMGQLGPTKGMVAATSFPFSSACIMRLFDSDKVHEGLPYQSLVPALIAGHLRDVNLSESLLQTQPSAGGGEDVFLNLPAWQRGRALGSKLVTVFPHNEHNGSGLPSVQGVFVLFDGGSGRPLAVLDGAALTLRKTAADSAAGSHFLAREDVENLLVVGAGALAPHLAMAHCTVRPGIRRVTIWNRTMARAKHMAKALALPGIEIAVAPDLEVAAREADLITCATMATAPLVRGEWLKPGAHLDLVGSFRPDMRECDGEALRRSSMFVDSRWSAIEDSGELVRAFAEGLLSPADIRADLFDLARGVHPGRRSAEELTVYKNGGGGHLDLMVAQILVSAELSGPA